MNTSASKHSAEETETWARALCITADSDPDEEIGMPLLPRWRSYENYARMALMARDMIAAKGPLQLGLL